MQVSEQFSKVIGATVASIAVIAAALFIVVCMNPPERVAAQGGGSVGLQSQLIPVFNSVTNSASSPILNDQGQGLNILFFCGSVFPGSIDLEWTPNPNLASPTYYPLVTASYTSLTNCKQIQVGGYWPNLRATVTFTAHGSGQAMSAWYSSTAGPVSGLAPALSTNGPTSPVVCDKNITVAATSGGTTWSGIAPGIIGGLNTIVVCGFSYSFSGATSGAMSAQWGTTSGCASLDAADWTVQTISTTPQTQPSGIGLRSSSLARQYLCITNSTGATAQLNFSYASLNAEY